jgi:hypothetical protein
MALRDTRHKFLGRYYNHRFVVSNIGLILNKKLGKTQNKVMVAYFEISVQQQFLTCDPRTPGGPRRLLRGSSTVSEIRYFFPADQ